MQSAPYHLSRAIEGLRTDPKFMDGDEQKLTEMADLERRLEEAKAIFDQPAYFVTDGAGRVLLANEDVSKLLPDGTLWGGEVPPEVLVAPSDYRFADGAFEEIEIPYEPRRVGTPREFLRLFTAEEQAAFVVARAASTDLEVWWLDASAGPFSLDHPSVAPGLDALVAAGVIAEARAEEIQGADFGA
jgi:hypothetical protein